jgi:hypothetical protein
MLTHGSIFMTELHQHRARTLWLSGLLHAFTHLYQVSLLPLYYLILKDKGVSRSRPSRTPRSW